MKVTMYKFLTAILLLSTAIVSCKKADLSTTETIVPTDKAFVRIGLYSPGTPSVMIKANDVKLNGNTTSGNGGIFPATVGFPDYAAVAPGSTFKLSLPNAGTQNDSVVLFNSKLDIQARKFYSLTLADTGVNRTAFFIEDEFVPQKDSILNVRLINAMVGSNLNLIRIDSNSASDVVRDTLARNIPYKGTSGFIQVKTFTSRSFIRMRITTTGGLSLGTPQIPPQALATGSRRSITYYAFGFVNGILTYAPGLSAHVTNQ
ncbi:MAG TPA: hypothetical protein VM884_11375 [Flavisolibacter sp.]|jgi:hypothetical protein|nr:hypothetical protein [Flavisolibacter sp.]